MLHCPRCGTEYEDSAHECMDCHSALRPGPPPVTLVEHKKRELHGDVKLVTAHVFNGPTAAMDAELAASWLESEGIPCVAAGANSARLYPIFDVPLLVREENLEEAQQVLEEYLNRDPASDGEPA